MFYYRDLPLTGPTTYAYQKSNNLGISFLDTACTIRKCNAIARKQKYHRQLEKSVELLRDLTRFSSCVFFCIKQDIYYMTRW